LHLAHVGCGLDEPRRMSLHVTGVIRLQATAKEEVTKLSFDLEKPFSDLRKAPVPCQDYAKPEMFG